jgi:hypothetical protein
VENSDEDSANQYVGIWSASLMTYLFLDGSKPVIDASCHVSITDSKITISYYEEEPPRNTDPKFRTAPPLQYSGRNDGDGHFKLVSIERGNKCSAAELHMRPNSKILVGSWSFDTALQGLWRIELKEGYGW